MDEYQAVEEIAYCEGNTSPLEHDRSSELAIECWNLRKTILEQSSQTLKHKQEIKSQKNLIKNLQTNVHDLQQDNLCKSRELLALKEKYLDLEKKLHDQVVTTKCVNSNLIKTKRSTLYLQLKITDAQNEIKATAAR